MRPECDQVAKLTSVRLEAVQEGGSTIVIGELIDNYPGNLWVPNEPVPSYRVDPQTGSVLVSYGYFQDIYGSYRGRYMIPPMRRVQPGERFRWRIEDATLLEKLLAPRTVSAVRLCVALREFPTSNTRGNQPVDEYLQNSCTVQSNPTILRK